jgi:hypothetical protein
MADKLAPGLAHWAGSEGNVIVYDLAVPACPISRGGTRRLPDGSAFPVSTDCGWWNDTSSKRWQDLDDFAPDVIVVQDGLNELPDRKLPSWAMWRWPGEPQFDSWLLDEYSTAFKTLTGGRAKVLFLNAVCANWDVMGGPWTGFAGGSGDARVAALDRTAQAITVTGATTADFNAHICPKGTYTSNVDGVSDARPDGYHLSQAASEAVAERWLGPLVLSTASGRSTL